MKNLTIIAGLCFFLVSGCFFVFSQEDSDVFVPVDPGVINIDQALLFDSRTWMGWRLQKDGPYGGGRFTIEDGAFCSDPAHPGLLLTTGQFSDFSLEFEMQAEDETNAFLLLRTSPSPKNLVTSCYAVVLSTSSTHPDRFPCEILGRPRLRSVIEDSNEKNADGTYPWKQFSVYANGKKVRISSGLYHDDESFEEETVRRGYIGFLVTKGKARFRNIRWSPTQTLSLFTMGNRSLNFWEEPEENANFTVHSNSVELTLTGGPGILETKMNFDNFILRAEFNVDGTESLGDIFFRCIPGEMLAGYRCSIDSRPLENSTITTLGERTGSLVPLKEARNVGAQNGQWNSLIIKALDNHFQIWVNGIQTVDYTDRRPEDISENPQHGLRFKEGTIQIHGRSLDSVLKFRNIEVSPISKRWISKEEERFLNEQRARELLPPRQKVVL